MNSIKRLTPCLSITGQVDPDDLKSLAEQGFRCIINNRPDGEGEDQPASETLAQAARDQGLDYHHLPVVSGRISGEDAAAFRSLMDTVSGPVLAFCRTGTRSTHLWALSEAHRLNPDSLLATAHSAGIDLVGIRPRLEQAWQQATATAQSGTVEARPPVPRHDVVIVGGGAAGCAVAASLLKRRSQLRVAIIEPADDHFYQPGWTLVGAGVFTQQRTRRAMAHCIPAGAEWIRQAAATFEPEQQQVVLDDGSRVGYQCLILCPGLELNWGGIEGLEETLGQNGVTSNYRYDLAPYTWKLVQQLKSGKAFFTQPPMPIKCAGAPQKAMYLSCDHWLRHGVLDQIEVNFCTAGAVLFGVSEFVPPLMKYVERYHARLQFSHNLIKVDGPARQAWFQVTDGDGNTSTEQCSFDMLHVVPPQRAPAVIRNSPFANSDGWVDVTHDTLRHKQFGDVFSLGDACGAPNAKTAAAVRKQAPVVAENVLSVLDGHQPRAVYEGYGSCPLTVERGKVVLAEFGYGGKLQPSFPLDPTVPRWLAWSLKAHWMPTIYFDLMLKGREWLAHPKHLDIDPDAPDAQPACDYDSDNRS